jgi:hypothetical protein
MLTTPQLVMALRSSRAAFASVFEQAQLGLPSKSRISFDSLALWPTDNENFAKALEYARENQFLPGLVDWLIDQNLEDGTLMRHAAMALEQPVPGSDSLQSMISTVSGFIQPDVMYRGILDGMRWTVKVAVQTADQRSEGTGVLIAPHLVITAWHVVKPLFEETDSVWSPKLLGTNQLTVQFDDYLRFVKPNRPPAQANSQIYTAADNWCVGFSSCHPDEYGGLPHNLADLDGFWDYAIIRLNKAPGIERRWVEPDARINVPGERGDFMLFQHAMAQPLKLDHGTIANIIPPEPSFVPRFRFVHQANALNGSSGGPCFNRGVPIGPILRHIKTANPEGLPAPDPELMPMCELAYKGQSVPVIDLDEVQTLGWRLATLGGPKILVLKGAKGSGKTFSVILLKAILPEGAHVKVELNAEAISKKDVLQLVEEICRNAGVSVPQIKSEAETRSTLPTWIRSEVIPNLLNALETIRRSRLVWLMLTELNKSVIEGYGSSEFLFQLYEQALSTDWLRLVFDDIQTELPDSLNAITRRYVVGEIRPQAFEQFVKRFFGTLSEPPNEFFVQTFRNFFVDKYDEFRANNAEQAKKSLAIELLKFTNSMRNADQ